MKTNSRAAHHRRNAKFALELAEWQLHRGMTDAEMAEVLSDYLARLLRIRTNSEPQASHPVGQASQVIDGRPVNPDGSLGAPLRRSVKRSANTDWVKLTNPQQPPYTAHFPDGA